MICYVDTSIWVAAFTNQLRTSEMQRWLEQEQQPLAISAWVTAELSSALSIKIRQTHLNVVTRDQILAVFADTARVSLVELPVTRDDFIQSARFVDRHDTALRAGDALHLAIASRNQATVYSLDAGLTAGAEALGVPARLL